MDEAGRGAIFGPVVAAAVILNKKNIEGIKDSKQLSPLKRKIIFEKILEHAYDIGIGMSNNIEIDEMKIQKANLLAMERAVRNLTVSPDFVLIDAYNLKNISIPQKSIIKGDSKVYSIAAASIVAKVIRDEMMKKLSEYFPFLNLEKNKGYATKFHTEIIKNLCPTLFHRFSFKGVKTN